MASADSDRGLVDAWRTSARVTIYLLEHLPDAVWEAAVPGAPKRTVQMIAGHLHNCRCMWLKELGKRYKIMSPESVDRQDVTRAALVEALGYSAQAVEALLEASLAAGGRLSGFSPPDAAHFLAYLVAHEGHHRGQIVMVARQVGHRLPDEVTYGLWQWNKRAREGAGS